MGGVKAEGEEYYRIIEQKKGENLCVLLNGVKPYASATSTAGVGKISLIDCYPPGSTGIFSFIVKGYNISELKDYTIEFDGYQIPVTGQGITNGIELSTDKITSENLELQIHETDDLTKKLKYASLTCDGTVSEECDLTTATDYTRFDSISFMFKYSSSGPTTPQLTEEEETELNAAFAITAPDGTVTFNTVEPSMMTAMMGLEFLIEQLTVKDGYAIDLMPSENGYDLTIYKEDNNNVRKTYGLNVVFTKTRVKKYSDIISEVVESLQEKESAFNSDYSERFIIEDLDSINYYFNAQKAKSEDAALLSLANYSSNLHKLVENLNIDFMFRAGCGGDASEFTENMIGMVDLIYNGDIYDSVDPVGFNLSNILYVPDDTEDTDEAFKEAALKRINEYLKGIDVEIAVGGSIADLAEGQNVWESHDGSSPTYHELVDPTTTTGKWFNITIGEETYKYFIVKDSSKMSKPIVKTVDGITNVYIMSDSFDVPLDSNIKANKLDVNSDEYKALSKKLNIIKGLAYDLNLYSNTLEMYVKKTESGSFKVYIPVDEETLNKRLVAAYIKDDGTMETHPVTFEGNYAVFETDHFSTYALVDAKNPKTGDNLVLYLLVLTVSGYALYKVRKFN